MQFLRDLLPASLPRLDPTRLWRQLKPEELERQAAQDVVDGRTLCQKLEPHLVRLQVSCEGGDMKKIF